MNYTFDWYNKRGSLQFNGTGKLYEFRYKKYDSSNRLIELLVTDQNGMETEKSLYQYNGQTEIWTLFKDGKLVKTEESIYDDKHNLIYNIRKDDKGKSLEWHKFDLDKFGNKIKYIWGKEEEQEIGFRTIELTYVSDK